MSSASFRKIRFLGPGRRLAASEGPKIAGGASLAGREKLKFPAIRQGEGCEIKSRLPPGPPAQSKTRPSQGSSCALPERPHFESEARARGCSKALTCPAEAFLELPGPFSAS